MPAYLITLATALCLLTIAAYIVSLGNTKLARILGKRKPPKRPDTVVKVDSVSGIRTIGETHHAEGLT